MRGAAFYPWELLEENGREKTGRMTLPVFGPVYRFRYWRSRICSSSSRSIVRISVRALLWLVM